MIRRIETIRLESLSIGYDSKKQTKIIAEGINAAISSGELTCLLGANGVGKSTLLKTLVSFLSPISGNISVMSKSLKEYSDREISKTVGMVFTDRCEVKNMSVRELVAMGRSPYTGFWGRLNAEDNRVVDEMISFINIDSLRNRMVDTLSDGERQKVMIAKTLTQETPIIILDEPTAFLDFPSKVEIFQLLSRLAREKKKTIFLSTHDLELALQIADKLWLMSKERGLITGSPEDLAMTGAMSRFFEREGIIFDKESGLFRIENNYNRTIRAIGHGQKYQMIRKALQRNGIAVSREIESDIVVDAGSLNDTKIIVRVLSSDTVMELSSVQEMLDLICKLD